ncbi:MAG: hypothetical protein AAF458_09825 [Pseudomonadota bacterium]
MLLVPMTLDAFAVGERVEILSLAQRRFDRASSLLGLFDGVVATIRSTAPRGWVQLEIDGEPLHVPAMLSRALICRRAIAR